MCVQECHTDKQQDQPLTPCTHAYDHITQHINNLADPMQQTTLYTRQECIIYNHYLQPILPHHVIIISLRVY